MFDKNLKDKVYIGIVEDVNDPNRKGRIKARVFGAYDDIPLEDIPYAAPHKSIAGKSFELPSVGKPVNVIYPEGDLYSPEYIYSENYNINLQNKLKSYSEEEYAKFVALLFDDRTQIFSDDSELTLDYKYNKMTIDNESINLQLKDNNQKITIGTLSADQQAVLGNHWMDFFDEFMDTLEKPTSLVGNLGAPVLRPELLIVIQKYRAIRETFLSDHIFLADDNKIDKIE